MPPRSVRLTQTLTATSTTPRSGKRYLNELSKLGANVDTDEYLYTEAKVALGLKDVQVARSLFAQCPPEYVNAQRYLRQCDTYDDLCEQGVVHRASSQELRKCLAAILKESSLSPVISRYAEALHRQGFSHVSVTTATMQTADAIARNAGMHDGHRAQFQAYAQVNTPTQERWSHAFLSALESCLAVARCAKQVWDLSEGRLTKDDERTLSSSSHRKGEDDTAE